MTTPTAPNSISFNQIVNEFGGLKTNSNQSGYDIGAYRVEQTVNGIKYRLDVDDLGLSPVPKSGQISFNDLRGRSLNVIVDINGGTKVNARNDKWNNNNTIVIGGGPKKEEGSRIIIHVRGTVQSERGTHPIGVDDGQGGTSGNRWRCALKTGSWEEIVSLDVIVGPGNNNGHIRGGGGNGGKGGTSDGEKSESEQDKANGFPGCHGTSALGLNHNIRNLVVNSGSTIYAGGGGGGGGAGAGGELDGDSSDERAGGGGGGGGMGTPAGLGGEAGSNNSGGERIPEDGENGNATSGGDGGRSGSNNESGGEDSADGGGGGGGGGINKGEGGAAETGEGGETGNDGDEMDNNLPTGDPGRGRGGDGGDGDAEGTGQQTGEGGEGGGFGGAVLKGGYNINSTTGNNRIYGNTRDTTPL